MKHSTGKHKGYGKRVKRKYRHLAAALAGAFVLTAGGLPGLPAVAHAAVSPNTEAPPPATTQAPQAEQAKAPEQAQKQLNMVATAYAPGPHDNQQWGNKTYLGTQIRPGIIAVDPKVIPLGSEVKIEYPDGHTEYAVAEDTGGAIKGNRIDVAKWSVSEAYKFGMKNVTVTVISSPQSVNK